MAFLSISGLKKAYDSLGAEISRSFDSSGFEEGQKKQPSESDVGIIAEKQGSREQSLSAPPAAVSTKDDSETWGEWKETAPPVRTPKKLSRGTSLGVKSLPGSLGGREKQHQIGKAGSIEETSSTPEPKFATPSNDRQQESKSKEMSTPLKSSESLHVDTPMQSVTFDTPKEGSKGIKSPPLASSTPAKGGGKSQLESLSREDLVKYIRKQAQLLTKTKARCEELTKECEKLKSAAPETSSNEGLLEELQVMKSERDKAVLECTALRQTMTGLEQDKQQMSLQLEVLKKEQEELTQSHRQLQEQFASQEEDFQCKLEASNTKLAGILELHKNEKEDFQKQVQILRAELEREREITATRAKEEPDFASEKEQLQSELTSLQKQLNNSQSECKQRESELGSLKSQMESVAGEATDLQGEVHSLKEQLQHSREEDKQQQSELERLRIEKEALASESGERELLRNEVEALKGELEQAQVLMRQHEKQVATLKGEKEKTSKQLLGKLKALREQLRQREEQCKQQERVVEVLRREKEAATKEADEQLQSELKALQDQLLGSQELCRQQESELEALRSAREGLNRESTEHSQGKVEVLQKQLQEVQQLCTQRESQLESLRKEKEQLQEGYKGSENLRDEMRALQSQFEQAQQQCRQRERELEVLQTEKESLVKEGSKARGEVEQLGGDVASLEERLRTKVGELETRIGSQGSELEVVRREKEALATRVRELEEGEEVLQSELATSQSDLATAHSHGNTHRMAAGKVQAELEGLRGELAREREGHSDTKQKLAAAQKEVKALAVMSLELEDYQRSMQSLENAVTSKDSQLEEARRESKLQYEEAQKLRKDLDLLGQQRSQDEEKRNKMRALIVKTKKELQEAKKQEGELQATITSLQSQLEEGKQHSEMAKVELSELTAKLQSTHQQSEVSMETLQRTIRTLEHKVGVAQGELATTQAALAHCQQEYDSYKVRVHSVLKQKSAGPSQAEISSELRQKFETEIAKLKAELQETKDQLSSTLVDHEELLVDHGQLSSRHEEMLRDAQVNQDSWQKRLQEVESRYHADSREQAELIAQLRQEVMEVTVAFKDQIHSLQEDHHRVVVGIREELKASHSEVSRLQQEADSRVLAKAASQDVGGASREQPRPRHLETRLAPTEPRSAGEGMDQSELESVSSTPGPLSREDSQVSFERLLVSNGDQLPSERATPGEARLRKQLRAATKKIEHLTEVLRESEAASMRLSDQAKLLKEEIRRLERNQEREQGVTNMEYLKNVVLKFLHTQGPEQSGLVPVITRLLQLSPQEIRFLQETIKGNPTDLPSAASPPSTPTTGSKGWGGYLHRWTGY